LLIRRSREQREEFEKHALIHLDSLMRSAARLCRTYEGAEDAVQQTYLQAWRYWNTFQSGTNCRSWLFRILFNVIKTGHEPPRQEVAIEDAAAENVLRFVPDRQLEAYEVLEVFGRLGEEHRAVLLLVAVEEMSYKEAAFALGVPVGTVMSRLNRARTQLRRLLRTDHGHAHGQIG
jgi:RNA polymerase sigma-70 factor, ECF subfamily